MTEVNHAEVKYMIIRRDGIEAWNEIAGSLSILPIEFHATTHSLSDLAGELKARHRMSLADTFAAALAEKGLIATRPCRLKIVRQDDRVPARNNVTHRR